MEELKPPEVMWNLSRMRVGGDVGGLVAVVGTVVVLIVGIPSVKWFLAAAGAFGTICALGLAMWHCRHPQSLKPANSIEAR